MKRGTGDGERIGSGGNTDEEVQRGKFSKRSDVILTTKIWYDYSKGIHFSKIHKSTIPIRNSKKFVPNVPPTVI